MSYGLADLSDAKDKYITELEELIKDYENEKLLSKASYDGVSSLLMSVQKDCIKAEARIAELEVLNAHYSSCWDSDIQEITRLNQRIAELEARNTALGEAVAYATQRFTKAEVKLLSAMDTLQYYNVEVRTPRKPAPPSQN